MTDTELLTLAKTLATDAHRGQTRWGGEPFITHPEAVAKILADSFEVGRHLEYQIVAWLHDICEDGGYTTEQLWQKGFSASTCAAVKALTRLPEEPYDAYIYRVGQQTVLAMRVKLADLSHNLSTSTDEQARTKRIIWRLSAMYLRMKLGARDLV